VKHPTYQEEQFGAVTHTCFIATSMAFKLRELSGVDTNVRATVVQSTGLARSLRKPRGTCG